MSEIVSLAIFKKEIQHGNVAAILGITSPTAKIEEIFYLPR